MQFVEPSFEETSIDDRSQGQFQLKEKERSSSEGTRITRLRQTAGLQLWEFEVSEGVPTDFLLAPDVRDHVDRESWELLNLSPTQGIRRIASVSILQHRLFFLAAQAVQLRTATKWAHVLAANRPVTATFLLEGAKLTKFSFSPVLLLLLPPTANPTNRPTVKKVVQARPATTRRRSAAARLPNVTDLRKPAVASISDATNMFRVLHTV